MSLALHVFPTGNGCLVIPVHMAELIVIATLPLVINCTVSSFPFWVHAISYQELASIMDNWVCEKFILLVCEAGASSAFQLRVNVRDQIRTLGG